MDERTALGLLADELPDAGDDAAVVGDQVLTIDMLHESTDFPDGVTHYTAGWRAVGASLSDVGAMGAEATAAVAAYGVPAFEPEDLLAFVRGANDVCERVGARYVGGDLDHHGEFTVSTAALGRTDEPVWRSGASPGDRVCVTGDLGRSAAAVRLFERGETDRANDLFRFDPRVETGRAIAPHATAMMDSSDGLARSLHQLAEASDCGFAIDADAIPVHEAVDDLATDEADRRSMGLYFGEDFELVFTVPESALEEVREAASVPITDIGDVTDADAGIAIDGETLPDRGYDHGATDG
ncbi:MAG TPA: thiamine-phosphate kinase [Natrialbaceae archaeon]|nr:thiamine-phosphate kinase [Natrialbaceae archaeon]